MRHKAPGRFVRFSHRLRRKAAHLLDLGAGATLGALVGTLAVTVALGVGAFLTFPTVTGENASEDTQAAQEPAPPRTLRPATTSTPSQGSEPADPTPQGSGQTSRAPKGTPPSSRDLTEAPESDPESDPETDTPGESPTSPPPTTHGRTPSDSRAPDTTVAVEQPAPDAARFTFAADEDAVFVCSLDGRAFAPCASPLVYSDLKPGWHTLAVAAVDHAGNTDPTPAKARWHANKGKPDDE